MNSHLFVRNRPFFVKMRDQSYRIASARFSELAINLRNPHLLEKDALKQLDAFIDALESCFEHASDAIRGLKRRRLRMYREDPQFGVLEEEIVLCHFLEEMLSNSRFLRMRLTTDLKMRLYRQRLRRIQAQAPGGDGFISKILGSLEKFHNMEFMAIDRLLELMSDRWKVGDDLFGILAEMKPTRESFAPSP